MKKSLILKAFGILATTAAASHWGYNNSAYALATQNAEDNSDLFAKNNHMSFSSMLPNKPQCTDDSPKQRIIILAGPGGYAFNKNNVLAMQTAFAKQGAISEVIGDGESRITTDDIKLALITTKKNSHPTTVVILSHGKQKNGIHHMVLGEDNSVASCQILNLFTEMLGTKVDFFSTFCHGGGALTCGINMTDSTIVALSPATEGTSSFDVNNFVSALSVRNEKKLDLSAQSLLKFYLSTLQTRVAPLIADKHGVRDLSKAFCSLLIDPITKKEKAIIYDTLGAILDRKEIDRILALISHGSEYEILAKDYGAALLISLVLDRGISKFSEYQPHKTCSACDCQRYFNEFSSIYSEQSYNAETPRRALMPKI